MGTHLRMPGEVGVAQWLKAPEALAEDPGSSPRPTYIRYDSTRTGDMETGG